MRIFKIALLAALFLQPFGFRASAQCSADQWELSAWARTDSYACGVIPKVEVHRTLTSKAPLGNPVTSLRDLVYTLSGTAYNGVSQEYTSSKIEANNLADWVVFYNVTPGHYKLSVTGTCPDGQKLVVESPFPLEVKNRVSYGKGPEIDNIRITASPACSATPLGKIRFSTFQTDSPVDVKISGASLPEPKVFHALVANRGITLPGSYAAGDYEIEVSLTNNPCGYAPVSKRITVPLEPEYEIDATANQYDRYDDETGEIIGKETYRNVSLRLANNPYLNDPTIAPSFRLLSGPAITNPVELQESEEGFVEDADPTHSFDYDWQAGDYEMEVSLGCLTRRLSIHVPENPPADPLYTNLTPFEQDCSYGFKLEVPGGGYGESPLVPASDFEARIVQGPGITSPRILHPVRWSSREEYGVKYTFEYSTSDWLPGEYTIEVRNRKTEQVSTHSHTVSSHQVEVDLNHAVLSRLNQATGLLALRNASPESKVRKIIIRQAPEEFNSYGKEISTEYGYQTFPSSTEVGGETKRLYYPSGNYEVELYSLSGCSFGRQTIYFPPQEATLSNAYSRPSSSCAPTGIIALQISNRRSEMNEDEQFTFTLISGPSINAPTPVATRYRTKGVFQFVGENWPAGDYVVEITDHEVNRSSRQSFTLPAEELQVSLNDSRSYGKSDCQSEGKIALNVTGATAPLTFKLKQAPGLTGERLVQATRSDSVYLLEGNDWRTGDYRIEVASTSAPCQTPTELSFTLKEAKWNISLDHRSTRPARGCEGGAFMIGAKLNGQNTTAMVNFTLIEGPDLTTPLRLTPRQENGIYVFEGERWKAGKYVVRAQVPDCNVEKDIYVSLPYQPDFTIAQHSSDYSNLYHCLKLKTFQITEEGESKNSTYAFSLIQGPNITEARPIELRADGSNKYSFSTQDMEVGEYVLLATNTSCGTTSSTRFRIEENYHGEPPLDPNCLRVEVTDYDALQSYPCGTATIDLKVRQGSGSYRFFLTQAPEGISVPQEVESTTSDKLHYRLKGNNWPPGNYHIRVEDVNCEICQGNLDFNIRENAPPQVNFDNGIAKECAGGSIRVLVQGGSGNFRFSVVQGPGFADETIVSAQKVSEENNGTERYYELQGYNWQAGQYRIAVDEQGGCKAYRTVANFTLEEGTLNLPTEYEIKPQLKAKDKLSFFYKYYYSIDWKHLEMGIAAEGESPDKWWPMGVVDTLDLPVPAGHDITEFYDRPFFVHFRAKGCPEKTVSFRKQVEYGGIIPSDLRLGSMRWASSFYLLGRESHLLPGRVEITEKGQSNLLYTAPWKRDSVMIPPIFEYGKTYVVKLIDANGVSLSTEVRHNWHLRKYDSPYNHYVYSPCGTIYPGYTQALALTRIFVKGQEQEIQGGVELLEDLLPITTTWTPDDGSPAITKKVWDRDELTSPLLKYDVNYRIDVALNNGQTFSDQVRHSASQETQNYYKEYSLERKDCQSIALVGKNGAEYPQGKYTLIDPTGKELYTDWHGGLTFRAPNLYPGEYTLTYDGTCQPAFTLKKRFEGAKNLRNIQTHKDLTCEGLNFSITADLYCGNEFLETVFFVPEGSSENADGQYFLRQPGTSMKMKYEIDGRNDERVETITVTYALPPMDLDQLYTVGYKCPESPTGSIFIKAKNGVAPYSYALVTAKESTTLLPGTEMQTSSDVVEYEYGEVGNTYAVLIEDACGNRTWDEITIQPLDQIGTVVGTKTPEVCIGGEIKLFSRSFGASSTYSWTGPDGFTSNEANPTISGATPAKSGTYTLTLQPKGCELRITQSVEVLVKPALSITPDDEASLQRHYCIGSPAPLLDGGGTITGGVAPYRYQWQQSYDGGANWYDIYGATQEHYQPSRLSPDQTYLFRRLVSDPCSTVTGPTIQLRGKSCWVPVNPHLMHRVGKAPLSPI